MGGGVTNVILKERAHRPRDDPPGVSGPDQRQTNGVVGECRLAFETNGLKRMYFQGVETESAFNTRGEPDVFNLHLRPLPG